MSVPLPVQAAVARLWAKRFASEKQAFGSREFFELARECHVTYGAPKDLSYVEWHKEKLETLFRNVGAPWYGGPSLNPAKVSEIIHFAYIGGPCTRTYLVPLDKAPEGLPDATFGPCRIVHLSKEDLADIVKPAALERHKRAPFDLDMFCQIMWLVIEEPVQLQPAKERDFLTRLGSFDFGDLNKVDYPDSIPDSRYIRPTIEWERHTQSSRIDLTLLTLLLHPWEKCVKFSHRTWRPFSIPWIYARNNILFCLQPLDRTLFTPCLLGKRYR